MPAWSPVQDLPLAPVRFTGPTADHFRAILNPRNLVLLQPAREQFAAPFEDRIGGGRKVSVDPFQILHDVEEELANRNGLCPAGTRPSEIFFRCQCFDLPEDFFFPEELGRPALAGAPRLNFGTATSRRFASEWRSSSAAIPRGHLRIV
jgi:hypothetical protein